MNRSLRYSLLYSFFLCLYSIFHFPFSLLPSLHAQPPFSVVEATIADMQAAMQQKRITSRGIVQQYLDRIAKYEDRLNAIITLNPRALEEADRLDRERAQGRIRGPLHGIPIALKDNITRPTCHDRRSARLQGVRAAVRSHADEASPRRGRDCHREDEHD
jgi:hypothetical protein